MHSAKHTLFFFLQILLFIGLWLCSTNLLGQNCLLVRESITAHDSLGNAIGQPIETTNNYFYNKDNNLEKSIPFYQQEYTWRYGNDTIVMQTNMGRTIYTYLLNEKGNAHHAYSTSYVYGGYDNEIMIDSNIEISSYTYDTTGHLIEMNQSGNKPYSFKKLKFIWKDGDKILDEEYNEQGMLKKRQIYEYYIEQPFQDLYPDSNIGFGTYSKHMVKSIAVEYNGHVIMKELFTYIYNSKGLVDKRITGNTQENRKTISEYTYDCR